jgi:hypothetical protein
MPRIVPDPGRLRVQFRDVLLYDLVCAARQNAAPERTRLSVEVEVARTAWMLPKRTF